MRVLQKTSTSPWMKWEHTLRLVRINWWKSRWVSDAAWLPVGTSSNKEIINYSAQGFHIIIIIWPMLERFCLFSRRRLTRRISVACWELWANIYINKVKILGCNIFIVLIFYVASISHKGWKVVWTLHFVVCSLCAVYIAPCLFSHLVSVRFVTDGTEQ